MATNRLLVKEEVATYARTLFDAVFSDGGRDAVLETRDQFELLLKLYRGNAELRDALSDPAFTQEQRNELVKGVFQGFDPMVVSVVAVMAERGNLGELPQGVSAYRSISEENMGVCVVDVTTVVELDDELRQLICEKLSADLGKDVVLREHIDKSILGGIIMSTQGKRIDASVASQLEHTRNVLTESNDGGEC